MFGYVTPLEGELKVKELNFYKSTYCGLCKAMGKRVCSESRMTLSYDVVFLVLVRFLLTEERISFVKTRCAVSPFKKKVVVARNATLDYCAAAGSLLAYHNIADDVSDKKGARRLAARMLLRAAKRMRRRAGLEALDAILTEKLSQLSCLEASGDATVDAAASRFGELLAEVFAYDLEGEKALIAREIGCHVGRWIYIADAADDYEKDRKRGEFNPLSEPDKERLRTSLLLESEAASRAIELIAPYDEGIKHIVDNILYLGMPHRIERILKRYPDAAERNINL